MLSHWLRHCCAGSALLEQSYSLFDESDWPGEVPRDQHSTASRATVTSRAAALLVLFSVAC
jgi:hypothetical protein